MWVGRKGGAGCLIQITKNIMNLAPGLCIGRSKCHIYCFSACRNWLEMFHSFGTPIGWKIQDGLEQYLQCSLAGQGENSITVHNSNCSLHFQMIRMSNYLKFFMGHLHSPNLWFCHCIMAKSKKLKGMESSEVCMSLTLLLHLLVVKFPYSLLAQVLTTIHNTKHMSDSA